MNILDQEDNRCHQCKKIFCCASCRDLHERKKHPRTKTDSDCRLCSLKKLPLEKFNDSRFLCHLVIRHLPLICVLCGEIYRSSSDLENFSKCEFWRKISRHSMPQDSLKKLPVQATPSPIVKTLSCPAAAGQKDSPDSESHTLQSFTSPPELIRNTSTPMHVGVSGQKSNPQFKTPKFPSLFLKTPKTPTASETIEEDPSPSLFYSATSQLLTSKEVNSDVTTFGSISAGSKSLISGDTPSRSTAIATPNRLSEDGCGYSREFFRTNSARILEVMEEQEEQGSVNMDLTEAQDHLHAVSSAAEAEIPPCNNTSISESVKDVPKRVRFSDQHQFMAAESTVDPVSDSEEFYEAPEIPGGKSIADKKSEAQMMQENEDNSDKENLGSPEDSKVFKTPSSTPAADATSSTSSRVVMMVVVENGFDISTSSLVPLINSSLQKLERNPLTESITSSISSISNQRQTTPNGTVRSVSSVDSYTASSTIDYYATELTPDSITPHTQASSSSSSSGSMGGGIFSAMAQAMRYAFRGLPGTGSSKASPDNYRSPLADSSSNGSLTSPSSFSTIATSLLRRPGKRSRDTINDAIIAHRRELRSPRNESGTSPAAKRPRSWHKIRGRDPIARMRRDTPPQTTSTRGVSSETQHFQQGSLSAGDTVIPLPSRAHQSTQTD